MIHHTRLLCSMVCFRLKMNRVEEMVDGVQRSEIRLKMVIDGDETNPRYWYTLMDIWGDYLALGNMSFAAPSQSIGGSGFSGEIKDVKLTLDGSETAE